MVTKDEQEVLVVPARVLDDLGRFQGFSEEPERYLSAFFEPGVPAFRPRGQVEEDPSFKQLIPYVILRHGSTVFCYTRGTSQGEARLHAFRSLGIGGHIDREDAGEQPNAQAYLNGLSRELEEEVHVASAGQLSLAGLINDDSTPVGSVHLGVVHLFELDRPEVDAREEGLQDAGFVELERIVAERERFETWSRFCIDALLRPETATGD